MVHAQWQRAPRRRRSLGANKAYDTFDFVDLMRELNTTPHVTQNLARPGGCGIDGRPTRHEGYAMTQHARPRIEPAFGWLKTIAWIRKGQAARAPEGRLALPVRERGLQSDSTAQAAAATGMTRATGRRSDVRPLRAAVCQAAAIH